MRGIASETASRKALGLLYDALALVSTYCVWWGSVVLVGNRPASFAAPLNVFRGFSQSPPDWFLACTAASLIAGALLFGLNPFRRAGGYGGAHFATDHEIRQQLRLRSRTGLILGEANGEYLRTDEPLSVLIYAPPGSGKTAGLIIPSLLSCGNSALVHDPKGELHEKTAGFRSRQGHTIWRFEPAATQSHAWNPLGKGELPPTWAGQVAHVDRIAASLIFGGKDETDYWTREARSMFMFFSLFLIFRDDETSLPKVRAFALAQQDPQDFIAGLLDNTPGLPQRIIEEGNGLMAKSPNEFSGVFGTFKSFLNAYGDEYIAANTSRSDFRLRDLRSAQTTIYLVIGNPDQTRLKPLASLFFELATLALLEEEPKSGEHPVTYFLDEFVRLGKMAEVLKMPAISRSYKVNAIFVCQSMSQVEGIYGREGADELRNTCSYHVVFAQQEQRIAQDISRSIGNTTRQKVTFSSPENNITRNTSESEEGIPLVLPQEVQSLPQFAILVLMQSHFQTPVRARATAWFKDAVMVKRIGMPLAEPRPPP